MVPKTVFLAMSYMLSLQKPSLMIEATGLNQKLLVVSFDGFRQAYFNDDRYLPWFSHFRRHGVYSDQMQSVFPSETFPNHYSIATGMYPESHGITANGMYDPLLDETFWKTDVSSDWWDQAEPIWLTAVRQNRRSAVSFWPGSNVVFPENMTATYYRPVYDKTVPLELRINETVNHLAYDNVDLAMIYYFQPDSDGHTFGVQSVEMNEQLQIVDWYLSYLLEKLDEVGLGEDKLNVILCADHEMVNITHVEYLSDYVSMRDIERIPSYGPVVNIQPKPGRTEAVYEALNNASIKGSPFKVYKKVDVPADYHYSNNARIMDIIVICDLGVYLQPVHAPNNVVGDHGYDPRNPEMRPIFLARGPAFKSNGYRAANSFETKDIYAIIAHVVGIEPRETNATLLNTLDIFAAASSVKFGISPIVLYCFACVILQQISFRV